VVSLDEPVDLLAGGGEEHPVPGLAGADPQPDRQMGLPRCPAGREKITFSPGADESKVPRWVTWSRRGLDQSRTPQGSCGLGIGRLDATLSAVRVTSCHLARVTRELVNFSCRTVVSIQLPSTTLC
jgi:hypothetical protein